MSLLVMHHLIQELKEDQNGKNRILCMMWWQITNNADMML